MPFLPTHLSFREIGDRLHLSRNTIKTQAISVYRKLGVSTRGDAIDEAVGWGWSEADRPARSSAASRPATESAAAAEVPPPATYLQLRAAQRSTRAGCAPRPTSAAPRARGRASRRDSRRRS